ncbi:type VI secretion system ATPase TssH [Glaciecola sp. 33A]|jgi:type VI secretion system protein VasG|uniref:type VI secretion system ATPase TssH n=1 Tax=Glaciecola sp. 33A TaxID=2057807 RepID=UPI000C31FA41|nr:type VI secretion system ATPase TssH [Glaciecola sp. 33A]PKI02983.1 type VI secretion system ATPase TssH [Glaciecola sp. 33A]
MAEISRVNLFGKLDPIAYKAIESATVFCKLRGNPYVELIHWFQQIVQLQDSDLHRIIAHFDINPSVLAKDMTNALDALPRGASSISDLSSKIEDSIERAWVYGSLVYGDSKVRMGYIILGMLKTRELKSSLLNMSGEFAKIKAEQLGDDFAQIVAGSCEDNTQASDGSAIGGAQPGSASDAMSPATMGKQEALNQFTTNLTEQAAKGELDPIIGRDEEIRQLIDILMRRRQNNPILTGEAGVGKTAVVEGFAHRINKGDVPPALKGVKLLCLDIGLLQAGASMKGEFENRLKQVIEEVKSSPTPIIMFIDETHTLIGAGGAAGTGDAANLLKPALARGELRTIGATTWAEYKKHIEKDPALTRRFQVVKVEEPSEEKAILMLRNIAGMLEKHHKVEMLDKAIEAAVKLSHRYIPARQLPDKAVSLLDTAAARVAVSQFATPAELEDCKQRIENLTVEQNVLEKEAAIGVVNQKRMNDIVECLTFEQDKEQALTEKWQQEKEVVNAVLSARKTLRDLLTEQKASALQVAEAAQNADGTPVTLIDNAAAITAAKAELDEQHAKLSELQGENPLILPACDEQAVASVVADWTGVPVGKMVNDEINTVLNLANIMKQRVIGQDHGMEMIAKRIQTSRAGLDNPNKPIGVFMLCGPSGTGKTETALALAEALYGGEQNVITINMSEFQEAHTVSTLKGAPPGYVGYGEGGILTEAVRRKPYSVVLLDEVEKAHSDVHEIFFQVFDKGVMEDGEGRSIDFKNTLILLTSNVGSDLIMNMCKDPDLMPEPEGMAKALREPQLGVFPAALLGRIVTIPYFPLSDDMIKSITRLQLDRIKHRVETGQGIDFVYDDSVVDLVVSRCTELESGGRMIDSILTNTLLPEISNKFLTHMLEGSPISKVEVTAEGGEFVYELSH